MQKFDNAGNYLEAQCNPRSDMSNRPLENADIFAEAIRTAGGRAASDMLRAGVAIYYMDAALADGIIKELPDGTRQRVEIGDEDDIVLETLPPGP